MLQSGLCLFLPRKAQIAAPAPSFVEACLGETSPTPPRAAIETAKDLLVRLIEANSAMPLNLLGTATDHPDFLVSVEALPFVYALRGDRDWKHAPGTAGANRVSPLVTQVWKLLEKRGVLTAPEIQEELGRELTEAAVVRALHELWASMRVVPLYQSGGQETLWEPLQSRHQKAMNSGVGMSQVTALSVLVSVYLQSVVAASGEEAEAFLSPLASRSKVREVVRGLSATRQLSLIQMETHSLLYVEGSLPEFAEADKPIAAEVEPKPARRIHPTSPEGIEAALARKSAGAARPAYKRPAAATGDAVPVRRTVARAGSNSFRPAAGEDSRKREGGTYRPAAGGQRPPFRSSNIPTERSEPGTGLRADGTPKKTRWRDLPGGRPDQKGKPARFGPRKTEGASGEERPRSTPRREAGSDRRPSESRPAFRPAAGSRPAYKSGERSGAPRENESYRSSGTSRPPVGRPSGGFRPAGGPPRSDRPSYGGKSSPTGGSRPPFRSGAARFERSSEGARPYSRPRRDEGASSARPPREGASAGDRKFTPRPPRAGGFAASRPSSFRPSTSRPSTGGSRPYSPRSGGSSASGKPSFGRSSSGGSSYRGPSSERPSSGRPSGRPFSGKPSGGKSFGGPSKAGTGRPSFKPDYKPRGAKPSGAAGARTGSRPGFGQGSRPGAGRPSAGRPGTASRPSRPPKFKKRPEPAE